jgi:hypothetical protein
VEDAKWISSLLRHSKISALGKIKWKFEVLQVFKVAGFRQQNGTNILARCLLAAPPTLLVKPGKNGKRKLSSGEMFWLIQSFGTI